MINERSIYQISAYLRQNTRSTPPSHRQCYIPINQSLPQKLKNIRSRLQPLTIARICQLAGDDDNKNSKISLEKFHVHPLPCLVVLFEVQKILDTGLIKRKACQMCILFLCQHITVLLMIGLRRRIALRKLSELSHGIDTDYKFFIRNGLQVPLAGTNLTNLCIDIKLDSLQVMHYLLLLSLTKDTQLLGLKLDRGLQLEKPAIYEGNKHNDLIILFLLLTNQQIQSLKYNFITGKVHPQK